MYNIGLLVSDFWYEERPRFKEGLGPISYVCGKIAYTAYYKNVTLDPLTGEITVGEAAEIEPLEGLDRVHFCGAGEIERYANADNYAATEGTEPLEEVWFYKEMNGIDADFIGWVYVPKGWNSSEAG